MTLTRYDSPRLPPDPIGDALADCYTFLLRKLDAKSGAKTPPTPVQASQGVKGSIRRETVAGSAEPLAVAD